MFWIIHLIALLFFFPALLVTIPLHLIYNAMKKKNEIAPQEKHEDA
jgi:hypothetical protein